MRDASTPIPDACRCRVPQTPQDLIDKGLYKALAKALYPGVFWPVSCALVAQGLGAHAVGRRRRGAFQTARAERAAGRLRPSSAPSAAAASSDAPPAPPAPPPAMDKAEGKRRSLFRSNSELHELSQGLAAHGGCLGAWLLAAAPKS